MLVVNCKKLTVKRQVIKPKESSIGKIFIQLFNYGVAKGKIPKDSILIKNTNEHKITSHKNNRLINYKGKLIAQRTLDMLYMRSLAQQGMMAGLFDYTFKYQVEHVGKKFACVAEIELKRDNTEKLSPSQVMYKQKLDNIGCPNIMTHDPEVALKFLIDLCKSYSF
jgi:hypothetical protein